MIVIAIDKVKIINNELSNFQFILKYKKEASIVVKMFIMLNENKL